MQNIAVSKLEKFSEQIIHGGNLHEAIRRYGFPYEHWIDLSTGINPIGYPIPYVPTEVWHHLPDEEDRLLLGCAAKYYNITNIANVLPVAGSQAAIRALPGLLPPDVVGIAPVTYSEYAPAFKRYGHSTESFDIQDNILKSTIRYVIVGNPNNPTTDQISIDRLLCWYAQISKRGGTLIVDEAFSDINTKDSLSPYIGHSGLIVLRSVGKFFGLAGIRSGFVLANEQLITELRDTLGMWTVSGPARYVVIKALTDIKWQNVAKRRLIDDSERLSVLLKGYGFAVRSTLLFSWITDPRAAILHSTLATHGIWTRRFLKPSSIRIGLPANKKQWQRLINSLEAYISKM
ncbi:MAG: threonine-phosphate decarboxylase CobD [Burkholderia sp.]|nr:threonine-phosphate decarboxylase CobD [Burkholderia sp.]